MSVVTIRHREARALDMDEPRLERWSTDNNLPVVAGIKDAPACGPWAQFSQ